MSSWWNNISRPPETMPVRASAFNLTSLPDKKGKLLLQFHLELCGQVKRVLTWSLTGFVKLLNSRLEQEGAQKANFTPSEPVTSLSPGSGISQGLLKDPSFADGTWWTVVTVPSSAICHLAGGNFVLSLGATANPLDTRDQHGHAPALTGAGASPKC